LLTETPRAFDEVWAHNWPTKSQQLFSLRHAAGYLIGHTINF